MVYKAIHGLVPPYSSMLISYYFPTGTFHPSHTKTPADQPNTKHFLMPLYIWFPVPHRMPSPPSPPTPHYPATFLNTQVMYSFFFPSHL